MSDNSSLPSSGASAASQARTNEKDFWMFTSVFFVVSMIPFLYASYIVMWPFGRSSDNANKAAKLQAEVILAVGFGINVTLVAIMLATQTQKSTVCYLVPE